MSTEVTRRSILQMAMAPALLTQLRVGDMPPTVSKVYPGPDGILTGSARAAEDARLSAEATEQQAAVERTEKALARKQAALRAQIAALEAEFASEAEFARLGLTDSEARSEQERAGRRAAGTRRTQAGAPNGASRPAKER